jgi:D-alanine-D-alanine ligase
VWLIGIDRRGGWIPFNQKRLNSENQVVLENKKSDEKAAVPYAHGDNFLSQNENESDLTVVFPVLHGPMGEDGTIQGLLKLANVPFVGAGVLGSAIGMDKDVMKRLLQAANIPVAKFIVFRDYEKESISFQFIRKGLGLPFFVKPANLGSSVGVSKVKRESEFKEALRKAFLYDRKILIEECIRGQEIECSVLGNDAPMASVPGEIIPKHEFYSYTAKYLDENGAALEIPAKLSKKLVKKIQDLAIKSFRVLSCEGMARVDFFLKESGELLVNEINTIPGFTAISMYPKLWEASGISYERLVDTLIRLAIERFRKERKLAASQI